MALIKKKTRKKLKKRIRKLIRRHGSELFMEVMTGVVANSLTDDSGKARQKLKKKLRRARKRGTMMPTAALSLVSAFLPSLSNLLPRSDRTAKPKKKHADPAEERLAVGS